MIRRPATAVRGAALLLVLWLIVLLTALVSGFALTARVESMQGRVLVRGLVAQSAARAGLEYALTRIGEQDPRLRWLPDGRPYMWRYADADIEITLVDESGKVDLNQADATLLTGLLRTLGQSQEQAPRLAAAIIDWRDPDQLTQVAGGAEDDDYAAADRPYGAKDAEFESIAELEQVLGFTPALYAGLEPHVTVFSGRTAPDEAFASGVVLDAMGRDGKALVAQRRQSDPVTGQPLGGEGVAGGTGTYSIQSRARLSDGREAVLRAVVRVGGNAVAGLAYTTLRWEEGASPR